MCLQEHEIQCPRITRRGSFKILKFPWTYLSHRGTQILVMFQSFVSRDRPMESAVEAPGLPFMNVSLLHSTQIPRVCISYQIIPTQGENPKVSNGTTSVNV